MPNSRCLLSSVGDDRNPEISTGHLHQSKRETVSALREGYGRDQ